MNTQKTTLNLPENLHAEAKAEAARLRMSSNTVGGSGFATGT